MPDLRPSLRFVWVPAIAMALVVAALYLVVRWWVAGDLEAATRLRVEQRSLLLASELESSMEGLQLQLRQLSRRLSLRPDGAVDEIRADMEWLQSRSKAFAWIGLATPDGRVRAGTGRWLEGVSVKERPVFANATQGPFLGEFHPALLLKPYLSGPGAGVPSLADIGLPLFDERGQLRAVLMAHVSHDWLVAQGERLVSPPEQSQLGFRWFILDSTGQPLNTALPFALPPALQSWTGEAAGRDGRGRHVVALRPVTVGREGASLHWTAVVALREAEAAAPLLAFDRRLAAATVLATLLAALLGYGVSRRLMRPYDRLLAVAGERYASASSSGDLKAYLDELSQELSRAGAEEGEDAESALLVRVARDASQLRHLLDSLPVAVCVLGEDGALLYANAVFGSFVGHLEPVDREVLLARLSRRTGGGADEVAAAPVLPIPGVGGRPRMVAVSSAPLRREVQQAERVLMLRDVTLEHQAQGAALEANERMLTFSDAVQDYALIALDAYGIIRGWSRGGSHIFGWSEEAALGLPFSQLFAPREPGAPGEPAPLGPDEILQRAQAGGAVPFEVTLLRADGSQLQARGSAYALRLREGGASFAVILTDATAAIASSRRLQESEQRLAAIVSGATDAIISIDEAGRITLFNPAAERIFRRPASEVLGAPLALLLPEGARAGHAASVAAFGQSGVTRRAMGGGIVQGLRSDGARLDLQASIAKASVQGQRVYTAILRDVSEQLAAERRERELQAERSALTQQLLQQEKETTRQLALSLHDELGQTVGAMRLLFDARVAQPGASGLAEADLRRLDELLVKLNGQLRSVLAELRPPLLDELGLVAALDNEIHSHDLAPMRVHLDGEGSRRWPSDVEWSAFLVAREALNNARLHSGADSVDVLVAGDADYLRVSVVDNGHGVEGLATRTYHGHLGLVGMRERAAAIGARLEIESSPDSGTEVSIEWRRSP